MDSPTRPNLGGDMAFEHFKIEHGFQSMLVSQFVCICLLAHNLGHNFEARFLIFSL